MEIGDQLLVTLACRLEKVTGSPDALYRFGGDEFIYLAEGLAGEADPEDYDDLAQAADTVVHEAASRLPSN